MVSVVSWTKDEDRMGNEADGWGEADLILHHRSYKDLAFVVKSNAKTLRFWKQRNDINRFVLF